MTGTQYIIFCRYLNKKTNQAVTNKTSIEWISAEEYENLEKFYNENKEQYEILNRVVINGGARKKNVGDDGIEWTSDRDDEDKDNNPWVIGKTARDSFSVYEQTIYDTCKRWLQIEKLERDEKCSIELCRIEPADTTEEKTEEMMQREIDAYNEILEQSYVKNPKFDMVFAFDGIAKTIAPFADYNEKSEEVKQLPYAYYDKMRRFELDPWFFYSAHGSLESAMQKAEELVNLFGKEAVLICKSVPLDQYIDIV